MKQAPKIHSIYTCSNAGLTMEWLEQARVTGSGIQGDRYALRLGAFSKSNPPKIRDITLITKMGIDMANHTLSSQGLARFAISETRRNIVIEHLLSEELNCLIGKVFRLGSVTLKGVELCIPCERPSKLADKKGFMNAFEHHGGIRAQVLNDGEITIGDLFSSE